MMEEISSSYYTFILHFIQNNWSVAGIQGVFSFKIYT